MIDPKEFRHVLGNFATGVNVVCSKDGDGFCGMTVNSFTSVSLEPPLVLFCPHHGAHALPKIQECKVFTVNILAQHQKQLCSVFAGKVPPEERFEGLDYKLGPATGCPVFGGCLAHLECRLWAQYNGGDHEILVGEVISMAAGEGDPMLFFRGQFPLLAHVDAAK